MRRTVRHILATSNPVGDLEALEKFVKVAPDTGADAVVVIGNLMPKTALVALVAGRGQKHEMLGASWVVVPGDLSEGEYSLLDLRSRKLETGNVH